MTTLQSKNPATGQVIWEGKITEPSEVHRSVDIAYDVSVQWRQTTLAHRCEILERYRDILKKKKTHLAVTIAQETGKVLWDARSEVEAMIAKVAISIKAYQERTGTRQEQLNNLRNVVRHRPHGVVAVIGPYNFPGHLPNGHIVPALLAGNTVVFKPSELTPLVAEETLRCWQEAKLPEGVLNVIQGGEVTGAALVAHSQVAGFFFTGSSVTGRRLHKLFGGQPEKILALEMGGNNPLVVWNVKDNKAAAYHTILSAFITSGQRCTCARRLIVSQNKKADEFLKHLVAMTSALKIGAYNDRPEPFMGPVINMEQVHKLLTAQDQLKKSGSKILLKMGLIKEPHPFLSPGILDVTGAKQRPDEEYFGPLLQVIRVPNFDRALDEANRTAYGLTAAIFCDDEKRYHRFYDHVRAGLINWNRQTTGAVSTAPFGGIGISGNHHPSAYYAADYCAYPVSSLEVEKIGMPQQISPGVTI